jgi:hypothetical protein
LRGHARRLIAFAFHFQVASHVAARLGAAHAQCLQVIKRGLGRRWQQALFGASRRAVLPASPATSTRRTACQLAANQLSGEYSQIHAAVWLDRLDLRRTRDEALLANKRAGADMIRTYFTKAVAEDLA